MRGDTELKTIHTDLLEIAFEDGGPDDGRPVLLLHGWPDAPCGWNGLAARLHAAGWRTIAPYLRGSGPTAEVRANPIEVARGRYHPSPLGRLAGGNSPTHADCLA